SVGAARTKNDRVAGHAPLNVGGGNSTQPGGVENDRRVRFPVFGLVFTGGLATSTRLHAIRTAPDIRIRGRRHRCPLTLALSRIWNRPSLWSRESQRERARDVAIAWAYLIAAGLCEVGWPIGLKWTQQPGWTLLGAAIAVISLAISGGLLFLAQRDISLGTSYAVWTGIGAAGTFLVGVWFFGDPSSFGRWLGATLIIAGVITLKLAH